MPQDLTLRCACGQVVGVVHGASPATGTRLVCHCKDCQAFAHHLGHADRMLDAAGGSDIFQTTPGRVTFTQGANHLACLRLSEKGLNRWYAACCKAPLGNTLRGPGLPFVGLPVSGLSAAEGPIEAAIGPPIGHFNVGPSAGAPKAAGVLPTAKVVLGFLRRTLGAKRRREPTPFFNPQTGRPVAEAHVLTEAERTAAYAPTV